MPRRFRSGIGSRRTSTAGCMAGCHSPRLFARSINTAAVRLAQDVGFGQRDKGRARARHSFTPPQGPQLGAGGGRCQPPRVDGCVRQHSGRASASAAAGCYLVRVTGERSHNGGWRAVRAQPHDGERQRGDAKTPHASRGTRDGAAGGARRFRCRQDRHHAKPQRMRGSSASTSPWWLVSGLATTTAAPMQGVTGGSLPATIWRQFMRAAAPNSSVLSAEPTPNRPEQQNSYAFSYNAPTNRVANGRRLFQANLDGSRVCSTATCTLALPSINRSAATDCTYQPLSGGPRTRCGVSTSRTSQASIRLANGPEADGRALKLQF